MELEYLRRRYYEELARAAIAQCDEAAKAHEQLADFFRRKIEMSGAFTIDAPVEQQQAQAG